MTAVEVRTLPFGKNKHSRRDHDFVLGIEAVQEDSIQHFSTKNLQETSKQMEVRR